MRDLLAHRGPDHAGLWHSAEGNTCLASRRLAILDPSPAAHQPFVSDDKRFVIVLNGEIYNFRELRSIFADEGIAFRTQSDVEVLLVAFRRWGVDCLKRLSGMFAFAVWDDLEHELFCARDRTGEKPFYYASCGDTFLFASELKSIVAWPHFRKQLHSPALIDFLTFGFVPDPATIWEGSYKLPPGNFLKVTLDASESPVVQGPHSWWDWTFAPDTSQREWGPAIREAVQRAASEMTVSDVPIGTFLSGGVDSSVVTAALSHAGHDLQSFTIGFAEHTHDERPYARRVSGLFDTTHTEQVVSADDVGSAFDALVWHFDEPLNDYSYLPTFYLCRMAREHVTVALSGDGGDEVFAGYRRYQRIGLRRDWGWLSSPLSPLFRSCATVASRWSPLRRTLSQHAMPPDEMMADMLNLGFPISVLQEVARGPLAQAVHAYSPLDTVRRHLDTAPVEEVGLLNAMRYLDLKLTLASGILVKVDRCSMAVSLEARPVFLHRDLLELASRIPDKLLADRGHSKEALKRAARTWLPDDLLYRRKMGFAMPLGKWLGSELQHFAQERAHSPLDELIEPGARDELFRRHLSGRADLTSCLHSLFFLERWLRRWW